MSHLVRNLHVEPRIPHQPYFQLPAVLETFATLVAAELKENLIGVYVIGSLALHGFDADSDVDFLVVVQHLLTQENFQYLQQIQTSIHHLGSYPALHMEGAYITLADLNDPMTVGQKELFYFDNGSTTPEWSTHDNQWHVRWILRERAIVVLGPHPKDLLDPVPAAELEAEMRNVLRIVKNDFVAEIDRPQSFWNSRFGQPHAVLTACRAWHTASSHAVHSKRQSAEWAKQMAAAEWGTFIDEALIERQGVRFGVKVGQKSEPAVLVQTGEFLKYVASEMKL